LALTPNIKRLAICMPPRVTYGVDGSSDRATPLPLYPKYWDRIDTFFFRSVFREAVQVALAKVPKRGRVHPFRHLREVDIYTPDATGTAFRPFTELMQLPTLKRIHFFSCNNAGGLLYRKMTGRPERHIRVRDLIIDNFSVLHGQGSNYLPQVLGCFESLEYFELGTYPRDGELESLLRSQRKSLQSLVLPNGGYKGRWATLGSLYGFTALKYFKCRVWALEKGDLKDNLPASLERLTLVKTIVEDATEALEDVTEALEDVAEALEELSYSVLANIFPHLQRICIEVARMPRVRPRPDGTPSPDRQARRRMLARLKENFRARGVEFCVTAVQSR